VAAPDPGKAFLAGGKLSYGCTSLATAYPHGGTALGMFGSIVLRVPSEHRLLIEEEHNAPGAVQWLGGALILGGRLRTWGDDDALKAIFPSASSTANGVTVHWPGSAAPPGAPLTALTNLVFTPINPAHPHLVIYKAVALPDRDASLPLTAYRYLDLPVVFVATPDAAGRHGSMGPKADLSLV